MVFFRKGRLNIPLLYLQRVLRLSPVMILIALFNRFLIQFCANGPMYSIMIDDKRQSCETAMWESLLYFSNFSSTQVLYCEKHLLYSICSPLFFFPMKTVFRFQCVLGSWYLAADMHLYLLTPFLVLLLQRHPKRFMCFSTVFISIDFILALNKNRLGLQKFENQILKLITQLIQIKLNI